MKTAMQEFVERNFYIDTEGEYHLKWTEDTPMNDELNEAFEKEKEQIIDAFRGTVDIVSGDVNEMAEEYYNQTYNQNK